MSSLPPSFAASAAFGSAVMRTPGLSPLIASSAASALAKLSAGVATGTKPLALTGGDVVGNKKVPGMPSFPASASSLSFPQRLMMILSQKEHTNVITWLPDGHSFVILQRETFMDDVMPKYFNTDQVGKGLKPTKNNSPPAKTNKYPSFTRKLNRW